MTNEEFNALEAELRRCLPFTIRYDHAEVIIFNDEGSFTIDLQTWHEFAKRKGDSMVIERVKKNVS